MTVFFRPPQAGWQLLSDGTDICLRVEDGTYYYLRNAFIMEWSMNLTPEINITLGANDLQLSDEEMKVMNIDTLTIKELFEQIKSKLKIRK